LEIVVVASVVVPVAVNSPLEFTTNFEPEYPVVEVLPAEKPLKNHVAAFSTVPPKDL
jgi:hypothetical protein